MQAIRHFTQISPGPVLPRIAVLSSFVLGTVFSALGVAQAEDFNFTDANRRNTVSFVLDAPFESIHAVANGVEGRVSIEKDRASGRFRVAVKSIQTGNESRDEHLTQENWLDASKWPQILFSFKDLKLPKSFRSGKAVTVNANGEFFIHGVRKTKPVKVKLQYFPKSELTQKRLPGNLVRVKSEFELKLSDFGVAQSDSKVKALLGLKVGEVAEVSLDFFGTDNG